MPLSSLWVDNLSQPEGHRATHVEMLNHKQLCKDKGSPESHHLHPLLRKSRMVLWTWE